MQNYPQKQWTNQFHVTGLSLYPPTIIRPRKPSKTLRILQPLNLSKRLLPTLPTGIAIREGKRHKLNFLSLQVWLIVNIQSYQLYTRDSKKFSSPLFANFWRPHPSLNKAVCVWVVPLSQFVCRFQLGPSIYSGSSSCARLHVVTLSNHLRIVSPTGIRAHIVLKVLIVLPPNQLNCSSMPLIFSNIISSERNGCTNFLNNI